MSITVNKPTQILPHLFIGGKAEAKSKSVLQSLKIKYIVNCTPSRDVDRNNGCPNYFEKEKSFKYQRIAVFDNKGEDLIGHMDRCHRFIEEGKHYGGVLIHCHKGVSRSATFVISYLMKYNEMTLEEALNYVQSVRPIVSPNPSFLEQLRTFEQQLDSLRNGKVLVAGSNDSVLSCTVAIGPSSGPITATTATAGPELASEQDIRLETTTLRTEMCLDVSTETVGSSKEASLTQSFTKDSLRDLHRHNKIEFSDKKSMEEGDSEVEAKKRRVSVTSQ